MALPSNNGVFIHEGYNCSPIIVPTAQSIPMSTSDSTTVKSAIDTILSDIAEEYDSTSTYAVNDCVIYNKILYKCKTAITTPEAWDSTHWDEIKAVDVGSGGGGGGASSLHDLSDVDDTGKTTGDTIVYDSAESKWLAKPITVTCTQAEYDAWASAVPSQIDPAILYLIMDAPMELPDASDVKYSNTISGLTATTVQAAIDEVEGSLSAVATSGNYTDLSNRPSIQTFVYPITKVSVSASSWLDITIPIQTGDWVSMTIKSSASSGAFTIRLQDSLGTLYRDDAPYHSQYNTPKVVAINKMVHDGSLNITSYTNIGATFDNCAITVTRMIQ